MMQEFDPGFIGFDIGTSPLNPDDWFYRRTQEEQERIDKAAANVAASGVCSFDEARSAIAAAQPQLNLSSLDDMAFVASRQTGQNYPHEKPLAKRVCPRKKRKHKNKTVYRRKR